MILASPGASAASSVNGCMRDSKACMLCDVNRTLRLVNCCSCYYGVLLSIVVITVFVVFLTGSYEVRFSQIYTAILRRYKNGK